jgi:hypothetical protein
MDSHHLDITQSHSIRSLGMYINLYINIMTKYKDPTYGHFTPVHFPEHRVAHLLHP